MGSGVWAEQEKGVLGWSRESSVWVEQERRWGGGDKFMRVRGVEVIGACVAGGEVNGMRVRGGGQVIRA